ncbi:hypothetical protein GE191_15575 [Serratia fonticola]|uniref:hypothetical protein n=1 Tax=Serratia fonticola TaxID=47917 RepID=UPI001378CE7C|nr:hypothetical protein [Serratia fonticola]NBJ35101.1 hypothetical protein [Serratia fonticola]
MDNMFEICRKMNAGRSAMCGKPPLPTMPQKEDEYAAMIADFSQVIESYKVKSRSWLYGPMLTLKQQIRVGDMKSQNAKLSDSTIGVAMACGRETQQITLTHAFRSTFYLPIPNASYKLVKRPKPSPFEKVAYLSAGRDPIRLDPGWDIPLDPGSNPGPLHFDQQGKAAITLPPCQAGYDYVLLVNPDITENDKANLFQSYQAVIKEYSDFLVKKWETSQRAEWARFIKIGAEVNVLEAAAEFMNGALSQLTQLFKTLEEVWKWLTNVDKYADKLRAFFNDDGLAKLKAMAEQGSKELKDSLSLLSDEIMMFIMGTAIYNYLQLLTPQQLANFLANAFGNLLVMFALMLVLPIGLCQKMLSTLDTLSGLVHTSDEGKAANHG